MVRGRGSLVEFHGLTQIKLLQSTHLCWQDTMQAWEWHRVLVTHEAPPSPRCCYHYHRWLEQGGCKKAMYISNNAVLCKATATLGDTACGNDRGIASVVCVAGYIEIHGSINRKAVPLSLPPSWQRQWPRQWQWQCIRECACTFSRPVHCWHDNSNARAVKCAMTCAMSAEMLPSLPSSLPCAMPPSVAVA